MVSGEAISFVIMLARFVMDLFKNCKCEQVCLINIIRHEGLVFDASRL